MILDRIVESTRKRVEQDKEQKSPDAMEAQAQAMEADTGFPFEEMLWENGIGFICEVKKASPSKGVIAEKFPYLDIARAYEQAGAGAISVLTEPEFSRGPPGICRRSGKRCRFRCCAKILSSMPTRSTRRKSWGRMRRS